MRLVGSVRAVTFVGLLSLSSTAMAQTAAPPPPGKDAEYKFGSLEEISKVVWKATAAAGFSATTGNSNVISFTGSGDVSRNDGSNKIALHAEGVYGYTQTPDFRKDQEIPSDPNGYMTHPGAADPGEVVTKRTTTAAYFMASARYDRYFTKHNSLYLTLLSGFDIPASKALFVSGQGGYARQVLKSRMHDISAELGYDFSFTRLTPPVTPPDGFLQDIFIHSGRIFLGYVLTVTDHTTVRANIEALINFNALHIGDRDVAVGQATRINSKLEFTTKIWKPLSFRAAFTLRYNNAPALSTAIPWALNNPDRYNSSLDTLSELGFVLNFL